MNIPDDVMQEARRASLDCIHGMCMTYRHDYGLMPEAERKALYVVMSQLAYHDVAPVIAQAIMEERQRCEDLVSKAEKEIRWEVIKLRGDQAYREYPAYSAHLINDLVTQIGEGEKP